jgi:hypothetical protein
MLSQSCKSPEGAVEKCARGHPWTPDNIYRDKRNNRRCRACIYERNRRRWHETASACGRGHPWTPENTRRKANGARMCVACHERRLGPKCSRGHPRTPENRGWSVSTGTYCRPCVARYKRRYRAEQKRREAWLRRDRDAAPLVAVIRRRLAAGWSQGDCARAMGCSQRQVQRYLSGETRKLRGCHPDNYVVGLDYMAHDLWPDIYEEAAA